MQKQSLPPGWRWAKLGEVCTAVRGVTFAAGDADSLPSPGQMACLTTSAVQEKIAWDTRRYIPALAVSPEQILIEGDLLVSTANSKELVGKACIVTKLPETTTFGAFVTVLRPNTTILPSFLWAIFKRRETKEYCYVSSSHTTGISNLRCSELLAFPIPLPPLPEQQRIAAVLDEAMAQVERARAAAKAQLADAKALPAAFLRQVFPAPGEPLPAGWRWAKLGEVCEVRAGVTLGRQMNGSPTREVPYLRVANVKDGRLDLEDVRLIEATEDEIGALRLTRGDLLFTEGGDPDKLGRGTYWADELPECIHQNHVFRARLDQHLFLPAFVSYFVASSYAKSYFLAHGRRTIGIATINQHVLKELPLPLSPIMEQRHIATMLSKQFQQAEELQARLEIQLAELEVLPASLLRQAFSGGL